MPTESVYCRIDELAGRLCRTARWSAWLCGALCIIIAAVFVGLLDLLFPLTEVVRRIALIGWLAGVVAAFAWGSVAGIPVRRRPAEFFATLLEHGREFAENALVNAVQFSRALSAGGAGAASVPLMQAEIDRAEHLAGSVMAAACVDRRSLHRRGMALGLVVLAVAATGLMWPGVWAAIAPRFYDPAGDHPPFCRTRFAVRYEGDNADRHIARGDNVRIIVDLSGELPNEAWLMRETADPSTRPTRIDLFRRSEAQWTARLDNVQEDMQFRVCVPRGYSKWQHLNLEPIPRITEARVAYAPPNDAARQPYERLLDRTGIRESRGTTVTLTITSDRPLKDGELLLAESGKEQRALKMEPSAGMPTRATVRFVLNHEGHISGAVRGIEGLRSRDRVEAELRLITGAPAADDDRRTRGDVAEDQNRRLLEEFRALVDAVRGLAKEAEGREAGLAPAAAERPADESTRKGLEELARGDRSLRQRAEDLVRRMGAAGPGRKEPSTQPGERGADESSESGRDLETLSRAVRETAERSGGRELSERLRKDGVANGEALRGVRRLLEDLKKDAKGLSDSACQGACKRLGDAAGAGDGPGGTAASSGGGSAAPGGGNDTLAPGADNRAAVRGARDAADASQGGTGVGPAVVGTGSVAAKTPPQAVASAPARAASGVETIRPDAPVAIDVGPVRGEQVPARYKDVTEAYFRRLAEENR